MKRTRIHLRIIGALLAASACGAWGHDGHEAGGARPEQLGEVDFPVSCSTPAQGEFNRAMALFHSFWFNPAVASFRKVLELDPECGMAEWGIAFMSICLLYTSDAADE